MAKYRTAKVLSDMGKKPNLGIVRDYLPKNYTATVRDGDVVIEGMDDHGWTLDGYVIPRLRSGLIVAVEIEE
jgi:hypothetical protein